MGLWLNAALFEVGELVQRVMFSVSSYDHAKYLSMFLRKCNATEYWCRPFTRPISASYCIWHWLSHAFCSLSRTGIAKRKLAPGPWTGLTMPAALTILSPPNLKPHGAGYEFSVQNINLQMRCVNLFHILTHRSLRRPLSKLCVCTD